MARPKFIEIDGKLVLWRDLVALRREQFATAKRSTQPTLFELKEDRRPRAERAGGDRYREPSLFTLLDQKR